MARLSKAGSQAWWPMRELTGRTEDGKKISREVYRNMETGAVFEPHNADGNPIGWNGSPPVSNARCKDGITLWSREYMRGYDKIKWDTPKEKSI